MPFCLCSVKLWLCPIWQLKGSDFEHSSCPFWLRTIHRIVRYTRRALLALLGFACDANRLILGSLVRLSNIVIITKKTPLHYSLLLFT